MKDEWVTTALSNDSVVVELLFRLRQSSSEPARPSLLSLPLGWGHRQPRSKPPISSSAKKDSATTTSTTRCSPTTPLSWSGGAASPSDGAYDDCSNSSRPSIDPSRSKGSYANEATNATTTSCKRSRKKKTFAELKEEENFLLQERVNLTKELASLHVTLEEQKARRENLKRIKFDLNLHSSGEPMVVVPNNQNNQMVASTSSEPGDADADADAASEELPRNGTREGYGSSSSAGVEQRSFFLPDLNMMPSEEANAAPDVPYGIN